MFGAVYCACQFNASGELLRQYTLLHPLPLFQGHAICPALISVEMYGLSEVPALISVEMYGLSEVRPEPPFKGDPKRKGLTQRFREPLQPFKEYTGFHGYTHLNVYCCSWGLLLGPSSVIKTNIAARRSQRQRWGKLLRDGVERIWAFPSA